MLDASQCICGCLSAGLESSVETTTTCTAVAKDLEEKPFYAARRLG